MSAEFKVFYNNEPATQEQLDEIEEIVVEQEVDRVWEARMKIPVCMTEEGSWGGEDDATKQAFTRVRIEVRIGEGEFVPLVDGRVVGNDSERSSIPGKSMITLVIHDDSALLHREEELQRYDGKSDSQIAQEIFDAAALGGTPDVETTPDIPDNPAAATIQRGTKMQILRSLAQRQRDFHAYVLPGENAGESIGCFKKFPTQPDENLPSLVMFGEDRNLAQFNVRENARSSSEVTAATMSFGDKSIVTATKSYRDTTLLGSDTANEPSSENITKRRLPPGQSDTVDLDAAAAGEAARSSFSLDADGSVLPLCYGGVLSPYRVVPVLLSDSRFSTNYVIFKVLHTLTRSQYTQSFSMKGNAVSAKPSGSGATTPAASASASVSINVQISIF
jgi:hypothetical protein